MDEGEQREREILAGYLVGTPVEGDEGQLARLFDLDLVDRWRAMSIIAGGEADSVDAALKNFYERREFYRDVRGDIEVP